MKKEYTNFAMTKKHRAELKELLLLGKEIFGSSYKFPDLFDDLLSNFNAEEIWSNVINEDYKKKKSLIKNTTKR